MFQWNQTNLIAHHTTLLTQTHEVNKLNVAKRLYQVMVRFSVLAEWLSEEEQTGCADSKYLVPRRLVPLLLAYGLLFWSARAGIHLVCFCGTWRAVIAECAMGPGTVGILFAMAAVVSRLLAVRGAWRLVAVDAARYDRLWAELQRQSGEHTCAGNMSRRSCT